MLQQLQKDMEEDEEIYDKIACWCTTNDKAKTKAIGDAEAKIEALTSRIEELSALSARLSTEIANLEKEVAGLEEALEQAKAIREKEIAEFQAEEKDLLESIAALGAAIEVLGKHHTSLLQVPTTHVLSVAATLQRELGKHRDLLDGVLTQGQRRAVAAFVQQPKDFFDATPTFKQAYAPQSGQIFGILKQMKETFETNLADAQKEEQAAQKAYEELKAAKEAEIGAAKESIAKKTAELADTDEKLAAAKEDLEDTKASMSADMKYLEMLKEKCSMTDKEWEERQKTRQLEIQAVSKAIAILSADDAHDTYTRTFNTALVQTQSKKDSALRSKASQLLKAVAQKLNSPRLATLALRVRLDAFTRVKKAIDDMIAQLMQEKEAEVKHKDFCVDELDKNRLETEKKEREKTDLLAHIEDLTMTIDTLTKEIETLKAEIADLQLQLKRAGEDREKESREFQLTVADQRATNKLVTAAITVLEGFYGKKASLLHLQSKQEPVGPPPPPGFKSYEKNKTSGGVMGLMRQIIEDAKAMEAEAIKGEEDAQAAYEALVKDTNASINQKAKERIDKSAIKAKTEQDKVDAEANLDSVNGELDELANYKAELHKSCDYVLNNFDIRQTARDEEVEALKQAKAILSGSKFSALLQR